MKEIENKNFIAKKIQIKDIQLAFGFKGRLETNRFIYDTLIPEGYIMRHNERWFRATEKLLDLAHLPKKLILDTFQSRFLSYNTFFSKTDLVELFLDNEQIVKGLIKHGYLLLQKSGNYIKSAKFEDDLAAGENVFSLLNSNERG